MNPANGVDGRIGRSKRAAPQLDSRRPEQEDRRACFVLMKLTGVFPDKVDVLKDHARHLDEQSPAGDAERDPLARRTVDPMP